MSDVPGEKALSLQEKLAARKAALAAGSPPAVDAAAAAAAPPLPTGATAPAMAADPTNPSSSSYGAAPASDASAPPLAPVTEMTDDDEALRREQDALASLITNPDHMDPRLSNGRRLSTAGPSLSSVSASSASITTSSGVLIPRVSATSGSLLIPVTHQQKELSRTLLPVRGKKQRGQQWPPHHEAALTDAVQCIGSEMQARGLFETLTSAQSGNALFARIRRDARFVLVLGNYSVMDLRSKWSQLCETDGMDTLDGAQIFGPVITPKLPTGYRTRALPFHARLTAALPLQPPMYGPDYGYCDSDTEVEDADMQRERLEGLRDTCLADRDVDPVWQYEQLKAGVSAADAEAERAAFAARVMADLESYYSHRSETLELGGGAEVAYGALVASFTGDVSVRSSYRVKSLKTYLMNICGMPLADTVATVRAVREAPVGPARRAVLAAAVAKLFQTSSFAREHFRQHVRGGVRHIDCRDIDSMAVAPVAAAAATEGEPQGDTSTT